MHGLFVLACIHPCQVSVESFEALKVFRLKPCHARGRLLKDCHASLCGNRFEEFSAPPVDFPACATRDASSGDKPGTPCMQVGVRKAFGPPGRSFSLLYSLHGGASVIRPTMPDQEMRISSSKHASSRASCSQNWPLKKKPRNARGPLLVGSC